MKAPPSIDPAGSISLESDSNLRCNAKALILLRKALARIDHTAARRRDQLDAGNVEPSHSTLYSRFDLLGRAPVDRRRPLGGPNIGYLIEMTR